MHYSYLANLDKLSLQRFLKKTVKKLRRKIYIDIHRNTQYCCAFIAGNGRSGTTWIADIISSQIPSRIMFEPFHSTEVHEFSKFQHCQYMRPLERNDTLFAYCQKVVKGDIRHHWIDREVTYIFPKYRLIKDVLANLFLKWLNNNFPDIPILFVIRHPCAVVLSRIEYNWSPDIDLNSFLRQDTLIEDFLTSKIDLIFKAKSLEERHAIIWCINNLVPLRQFGTKSINIFFYENLCNRPEVEITRIFHLIGHQYNDSIYSYLDHPSITSLPSSAVVTGEDKISRWKEKLSTDQICRILSIVRAFELDYLYDNSDIPLLENL